MAKEERKVKEIYEGKSEHGRSTIILKCPFCDEKIEAFIWSLRGCGKKCACGAKFNSSTYNGYTSTK